MRRLPVADGVRALVSAGQLVVLRPRGVSMVPTIFPGDRVVVGATAPPLLRVGAIVLCDGPRLHRLVRLDHRHGTIATRGDAHHRNDVEQPLASVAAAVLAIHPAPLARLRFWVANTCRRVLQHRRCSAAGYPRR